MNRCACGLELTGRVADYHCGACHENFPTEAAIVAHYDADGQCIPWEAFVTCHNCRVTFPSNEALEAHRDPDGRCLPS